jgi:uncharacterized protein
MSDRTLVYLHGFNSSPQSVKGSKLARALEQLRDPPRYWRPQLHHQPREAMRTLTTWIDDEVTDPSHLTLIGSSLGGFYATWLAERYKAARAIVINPAIRPYDSLAAYAGPQANPYTGERYALTAQHFAELEALRIERITAPSRYFLLVRTGDMLLDWRESVRYYAGSFQYVVGGGDHGFEDIDAAIPAMLQFAGVEGDEGNGGAASS